MATRLGLSNIKRNEHGRMIHADITFIMDARASAALSEGVQDAQVAIDNAMVRYLMAYVPLKQGMSGGLQSTIPRETHPGDGEVIVGGPYGHYQNFLDMPYKTVPAPTSPRGSHFVERVIRDHGDDIVDEGQGALNRKLR